MSPLLNRYRWNFYAIGGILSYVIRWFGFWFEPNFLRIFTIYNHSFASKLGDLYTFERLASFKPWWAGVKSLRHKIELIHLNWFSCTEARSGDQGILVDSKLYPYPGLRLCRLWIQNYPQLFFFHSSYFYAQKVRYQEEPQLSLWTGWQMIGDCHRQQRVFFTSSFSRFRRNKTFQLWVKKKDARTSVWRTIRQIIICFSDENFCAHNFDIMVHFKWK